MSTYEISKSSLLSLKAEILRKQEEVSKVKLQNKSKLAEQARKGTPLDLKNKGVNQREANDLPDEDDDLLKKSRTVLEAKSKLYDKLSKGVSVDDEVNARFLVRFDKKQRDNLDVPPEDSDGEMDVDMHPESEEEDHFSDEYEPATNPDDEWVDYVDCLGRTRKCLRKDLEYIKRKDSDLKSTIRKHGSDDEKEEVAKEAEEPRQPEKEFNEDSELLSGDMRRELLRQQWEEEEDELRHKSDIHYQDILFNEARTHGVGYYGFSKDEDERARQQEALKKLRQETQEQQRKAEELKQMREKQLAARVKAARNRKRARMGLPPEEDEPEKPVVKENDETNKQEKTEEELKKEKERELLRQKHIRPWDYGKEGVKQHVEYSQEDWLKKQRKERVEEFAPPSSYRGRKRSSDDDHDNSKVDKSLYFTTKKKRDRGKDEDDKFFVDTSKPPPKINNPSKQRLSTYSSVETDKEKRSYRNTKAVPIVNECVDFDDEQDRLLQDYLGTSDANATSTLSDSSDEDRGRGVEISPPPTFEYYGPSSAKTNKRPSKPTSLEDSISAGLQFLRQQVEKKKKSTKHPKEMFLL